MDFLAELKSKYPYMEDIDIEKILNRAKAIYYMIKYPCEPDINEEKNPITNFTEQMWVLMACDELIDKIGIGSAVSYKENGISMSFDNSVISSTLISMITPIAGVF